MSDYDITKQNLFYAFYEAILCQFYDFQTFLFVAH